MRPSTTDTSIILCSITLALTAALGCAASSGDEAASASPPRDDGRAVTDVADELAAAVAQWHGSCDARGVHGLCLEVDTLTAPGVGCGAPQLGRIRVKPRTSAAADALDAIDDALAVAADVGTPDDAAAMRTAMARGQLVAVDAELETYLAIELPAEPEAFVSAFTRKRVAGEAITTALAEFKHLDDPALVGAAALRTGWVYTHLADALEGLPVPPEFSGDARETYCRELDSVSVAQLRAQARAVGQWCQRVAERPNWRGPELEACIALAPGG
ncbi:MAG: hypothetical protein IPH07_16470 [Deltaproteobacteria bacterium]|nr:hypothetical protein [Deltaproteobacteria bacterium]MBK8720284.1 hypothetical protein [Deltaproteobacteria bacterium]MBP7287653.1 hypothetical protein [Nannocystaceae bacterium]